MSILKVLERAPALAGVDSATLERMANHAVTRTLSRGEFLWRAGDTPDALTVIRSGLIKVVRNAARGRSAICGLFGASEAIGDVALLKGIPYPADAVVATEVAGVIMVPQKLVLEEAMHNPQLAISLACETYTKIVALHDKIDVLSAGSVEARLATLLLKLYDKFGDDYEDGTSRIPIALSRRELSDLVSTSFETAIRVMTRWEREALVATEPGGFVLRNLHALEHISGGSLPLHAAAAE